MNLGTGLLFGDAVGVGVSEVIRVVRDTLPAVVVADPDSAYFKLDDDTLWKIEYDDVAATEASIVAARFANVLGSIYHGEFPSDPTVSLEAYYFNLTDKKFYHKPAGIQTAVVTSRVLDAFDTLPDPHLDFSGIRFTHPHNAFLAFTDRYYNVADGFWYRYNHEISEWDRIPNATALETYLSGMLFLSGDRYQEIGKPNVKTNAQAAQALLEIPGFNIDTETPFFHSGVTGQSHIGPPKLTTIYNIEDRVAEDHDLGSNYIGPFPTAGTLPPATALVDNIFVFIIDVQRFAHSSSGIWEFASTGATFDDYFPVASFEWAGGDTGTTANADGGGGYADLFALETEIEEGNLIHTDAIPLMYWNEALEQLRVVTSYTPYVSTGLVLGERALPDGALGPDFFGAIMRADRPDATDNPNAYYYEIDLDMRLKYSSGSGYINSDSFSLLQLNFPTDEYLWAGGNLTSVSNIIGQAAYADADAALAEIADGLFGQDNNEPFTESSFPLVYFNEELQELRIVSYAAPAIEAPPTTTTTTTVVYTEGELPVGTLGTGYQGEFTRADRPDPEDHVTGDFYYEIDDQESFLRHSSVGWQDTSQASLFNGFFPEETYLWAGGNGAQVANVDGQGAYANAAAILTELEDGLFGRDNNEVFDETTNPLLYWNEELQAMRVVTASAETTVVEDDEDEDEEEDDTTVVDPVAPVDRQYEKEEHYMIERELDVANLETNFRGYLTVVPPTGSANDYYYDPNDGYFWFYQQPNWLSVSSGSQLQDIFDTSRYEIASSNQNPDGGSNYANTAAVLAALRDRTAHFVQGRHTIYYNQELLRFQEITFYAARLEDTITSVPAIATHLGTNYQGAFATVTALPDVTTLAASDYALVLEDYRLYIVLGANVDLGITEATWEIINTQPLLDAALPSTSGWLGGDNGSGEVSDIIRLAADFNHGDRTHDNSVQVIFYNLENSRLEVITSFVEAGTGDMHEVETFETPVSFEESTLEAASGRSADVIEWIAEIGTNAEIAAYIEENIIYDDGKVYYVENDLEQIIEISSFTPVVPAHQVPRYQQITIGGTISEDDLRMILGYTVAQQAETFVGANLSGNTIVFDQVGGSTVDVVLPAGTSVTGVSLSDGILTITRAGLPSLTVDLSSLVSPDDFVYVIPSEVSVSGNVYTLTPAIALTGYTAGIQIAFAAESNNNAQISINISGLGFRNLLRSDRTNIQNGDVVSGQLIIATVTGAGELVTAIDPPDVLSEVTVRLLIGLTQAQQDGLISNLTISGSTLTATRLDGTTFTLTLPATGGSTATEAQIRTALGLTSAEQMATFIDANYNAVTGAIDFTQEDGSTHSVTLPTYVDEHISGSALDNATGMLTLSFEGSTPSIVIDLSSIASIDDSIYIPPSGVVHTGNLITLNSQDDVSEYTNGMEIIFEIESTNTTTGMFVTLDGLGARGLRKKDSSFMAAGELPAGLFVRAVFNGSWFISDVEASEVTRTSVYDIIRTMVLAGDHQTINLDPVDETLEVIGEPAELNETLSGEFQRAETVIVQATSIIVGLTKGSALLARQANPISVLYGSSSAQILDVDGGSDRITIAKKGIYHIQFHCLLNIGVARPIPRLEMFNYDDDEDTDTPIGRTTSEYMRVTGDNQELTLDGLLWVAEDNTDIKVIPSNEWEYNSQAPSDFSIQSGAEFIVLRISETGVPIERRAPDDRVSAEDAHPNYLYIDVDVDDTIETIKVKNKLDDHFFAVTPASVANSPATTYIGYASELLGSIVVAGGTSGSTKIRYLYEQEVSDDEFRLFIGINETDLGDFADSDHLYIQFGEEEDAIELHNFTQIVTPGFRMWYIRRFADSGILTVGTEVNVAIFGDNGSALETKADKKSVYSTFNIKNLENDERVVYEHINMIHATVPYSPGLIYPGTASDEAASPQNLYQDRKYEIGNLVYSSNKNKPVNWLGIRTGARGDVDLHAGEAVDSDLIRGTVYRPTAGNCQVNADILLETGVEDGLNIVLLEIVSGTDIAKIVAIGSSGSNTSSPRFAAGVLATHGQLISHVFPVDGETDYCIVFGLNKPNTDVLTDDVLGLYVWRGADFMLEWKRIKV